MMITIENANFHFPPEFDERAEYEMELKGYLCGGEVELEDGRRFPITFFDPVRLSQDLEILASRGEPAFIEPALVVIPHITRDVISRAIPELLRQRFFDHVVPCMVPVTNGVV